MICAVKRNFQSFLLQIDGMSKDDMRDTIRKYNMKSPITGNDLTDPVGFNLMFSTSIGPAGNIKG